MIAWEQTLESPDQETSYSILFVQLPGGISGKQDKLMLPSQPLAYASHVLFYHADSGEVSPLAHLENIHFQTSYGFSFLQMKT